MIARKIERLDERDRRLLVAASVQGHEFDSTTISEALEIDAADVEERLEALDRVHVFVKPAGEAEFADRTLTLRYRFVHILYQNTLYRVAAADPARGAERQGRGVDRAAPGQPNWRRRGAARHPVRRGARFPRGGARSSSSAARHAAGLFAFREAITLCAARAEGARRHCPRIRRACRSSSACS